MARILTVTINPAIDVWTSVERLEPARKLRCAAARRDPGGGGLNVARVAARFGANVTALYPIGGNSGQLLRHLVNEDGVRSLTFQIREETRQDFTVQETRSGAEYRFVLAGPKLLEAEWMKCLESVTVFPGPLDYLVVSGSIPPGVPEDFYARIVKIARARAVPVALDASGPALRAAIDEGVDLLKASVGELSDLTGLPLADQDSWVAACTGLVKAGKARMVALTLGSQGALLVTPDGAWRAQPMPVKAMTTVGAGDSFLGAMVWALTSGASPETSFRHGVAAATAALLAPGTQLCQTADARAFFDCIVIEPIARHAEIDRPADAARDAIELRAMAGGAAVLEFTGALRPS